MIRVFLVRHGESEANAKLIHQGQKVDTSLTPKGRGQAEKTAERLGREKIDAIYASDLKRTKETAEIISKNHKVKVILDKRLREFDAGDFINAFNGWEEFDKYKAAEAKKRGIKDYEVTIPGGESEWDHFCRIESILKEIIDSGHKNVVIVAHGGTNRVFFWVIKHLQHSEIYNVEQHNCCVNEMDFDDKKWAVHKINCFKHLDSGELVEIIEPSEKIFSLARDVQEKIKKVLPGAETRLIGSFAVPICGRKEMDILVEVENIEEAQDILGKAGFSKGPIIQREAFLKLRADGMIYDIHILVHGDKKIKSYDKVINTLKENKKLKEKYEKLKRSLNGKTAMEYKEAKSKFLKENVFGNK
jgi:broad specificity phosphatase PhoE